MDNKFSNKVDNSENKNKTKPFWKSVGYIALAIFLAVITIFVLNLNK